MSYLSRLLEYLYRFDSVRSLKHRLRPLKHAICGVSDIYYVLAELTQARGAGNPVQMILDVGAAHGDNTITFLKTFPTAKVLCFEPQRSKDPRLQRRVAPWGGRVQLFAFGFYNVNTEPEMVAYSYSDASSILPMQPYLERQGKREIGRERIAVRRLDAFVREQNIKKTDFLNIDVEGVEKKVLEGAPSLSI